MDASIQSATPIPLGNTSERSIEYAKYAYRFHLLSLSRRFLTEKLNRFPPADCRTIINRYAFNEQSGVVERSADRLPRLRMEQLDDPWEENRWCNKMNVLKRSLDRSGYYRVCLTVTSRLFLESRSGIMSCILRVEQWRLIRSYALLDLSY